MGSNPTPSARLEPYHKVTIALTAEGAHTRVRLTQDNNANEQAREHSDKNWQTVLAGLKDLLER